MEGWVRWRFRGMSHSVHLGWSVVGFGIEAKGTVCEWCRDSRLNAPSHGQSFQKVSNFFQIPIQSSSLVDLQPHSQPSYYATPSRSLSWSEDGGGNIMAPSTQCATALCPPRFAPLPGSTRTPSSNPTNSHAFANARAFDRGHLSARRRQSPNVRCDAPPSLEATLPWI